MMLEAFISQIEGIEHERNFILAPHTTFRIGGPADVMVSVRSEPELLRVLGAAHKNEMPIFILGGGSNLLISDEGIRGIVLRLKGDLAKIEVNASSDEIWVGTGASFPKLTRMALDLGWACALGWNGTPGQVGGALKMNAGTRLGEIGDVVEEVHAISHTGPQIFQKSDIQFSYRKTSFPERVVLTKARLKYDKRAPEQIPELLSKAQELADKRKKSQPKLRSAGSIFKNPPNDFAGRLIEAAGLKGVEVGGARISDVHANFIVNAGRATARDVYNLSKVAQSEVFKKFNIALEYEVKLIGNFTVNHTGTL